MTAKDSKSTPKKAERHPLALLADWVEMGQTLNNMHMSGQPLSGHIMLARTRLLDELSELDPAALRAQAEAEGHADRTPSDASTCPCANCGTVWSRAEEHRFGEMYDGEWVCSKACEDEHNALGCPFEQGDSYRIPFRDRAQMETERRLREALRTLCDLNDNPPPPEQRGVLANIAWTNARAALAQAGGEG